MLRDELINIAFLGQATQSSISRWSKKNDAQCAVNGYNGEFAFHTDHELNPWWQLRFRTELPVSKIIIHNRRNMNFIARCNFLKVESSNDGLHWDIIHHQEQTFAYDEKALVVDFSGFKSMKFLRISTTNNYFHLSKVEVLVLKTSLTPVLVTNRHDGLGQRLLGLLHCIAFAKVFNFDMGFTWLNNKEDNAYHDVLPKELMFQKAFIDRYYYHESEINHSIDAQDLRDIKDIATYEFGKKYMTWRVDKYVESDTLASMQISFKEIYSSIQFGDDIQFAQKKANEFVLDDDIVGIHIRAGDVVYGVFRNTQAFVKKVLPFPIVEYLVEQCLGKNKKIIIFGQDIEFQNYLKNKFPSIILAKDLYEESFSSVQKAFFDISLMSRCTEFYGGDSGFNEIAALIGKFKVCDPHIQFELDQILSILEDRLFNSSTLDGIPSQQIAFACSTYIYYGYKIKSFDKLKLANDLAIQHDSTNTFYLILNILFLYRSEEIDLAELKIKEILTENPNKLLRICRSFYSDQLNRNVMAMNEYFDCLGGVLTSQQNLPYANLLFGLISYYEKDLVRAKAHLNKAKEFIDVSFLDFNLL